MGDGRVVCEEVDVVFTVRKLNAQGQTVGLEQTHPVKLLRAVTPDVWGWVDDQLAKVPTK